MLCVSFSYRGPVRGKRCLQINVPTKHYTESWARSYFCWPHDGIYKFTWLTHAPSAEERGNCLLWNEPRDPTWGDKKYYLCATKDQQPIGMFCCCLYYLRLSMLLFFLLFFICFSFFSFVFLWFWLFFCTCMFFK